VTNRDLFYNFFIGFLAFNRQGAKVLEDGQRQKHSTFNAQLSKAASQSVLLLPVLLNVKEQFHAHGKITLNFRVISAVPCGDGRMIA
jgi:hypothetical protein